jgi:hypothetical protein
MRNGLLLAVGVLTLALLPAVTNASAPIFTDVPGVICLTEDGGTTRAATNVFVFDDAVTDPDSSVASLAWSFVETTEDLTVTDVDGAGPANVFVTLDGIGAVADKTAARGIAAGSVSDIANTATQFSLIVSTGTVGQSASAVAMAAGTNFAYQTGVDDIFTTIIIAVTDGVNATYKTVLVKSDYSVTGGTETGGLYSEVEATANASLNTRLVFIDQWANGTVSNGNGTNEVLINNPGTANLQPGGGGYIGPWGYGYFTTQGSTGGGFTVAPGYVYRLKTTVKAVGGDTGTGSSSIPNMRMRLQPASNDFVAEFTMQPIKVNDPLQPNAAGKTYEALLQPPQDARYDGDAYNTQYNYYLEITPYFNYQTTNISFSDVVIDRFPIPGRGDNGLVYYAETDTQWQTFTDGTGTTVSAPFRWGAGADLTGKGWCKVPRGLNDFIIDGNNLQLPTVTGSEYSVAIGGGTTTAGPAVCDIRTGTAAASGEVEIVSLASASTEFTGCYSEFFIGEPAIAAADSNAGFSIVNPTLLTKWGTDVYYRCTFGVQLGSTSAAGKNAQLYLRLGTPNSGFAGNLQVNEGSTVGPVSTDQTFYTTWVRGWPYTAAASDQTQNMQIKLQVVDSNNLGTDSTIGGSIILNSCSLEVFPAAYFN